MPCNDYPRMDSEQVKDWRSMQRRLDEVTRLLCSATNEMVVEDIKDPELRAWVQDHREIDRLRSLPIGKNEPTKT